MEASDRIKMLDSNVLEQFNPSTWMDIALVSIVAMMLLASEIYVNNADLLQEHGTPAR